MDIKPSNFLVYHNFDIKLSDFGMTIHIDNPLKVDILEGDCRYYANELLNNTMCKHILDFKTDIFSLGLSIAEIMFKLELPKNGPLWEEIRSDGFRFDEEAFKYSEVKNIDGDILKMIYWMMSVDPVNRPSTNELLEFVPQLKNRNLELKKNQYKKCGKLSVIEEIESFMNSV